METQDGVIPESCIILLPTFMGYLSLGHGFPWFRGWILPLPEEDPTSLSPHFLQAPGINSLREMILGNLPLYWITSLAFREWEEQSCCGNANETSGKAPSLRNILIVLAPRQLIASSRLIPSFWERLECAVFPGIKELRLGLFVLIPEPLALSVMLGFVEHKFLL